MVLGKGEKKIVAFSNVGMITVITAIKLMTEVNIEISGILCSVTKSTKLKFL